MRKYFAPLMLCVLLASSAVAQSDRRLLDRDGDEFRGPVRSVRTEVAMVSRTAGAAAAEGPRRLLRVRTYSADGRRCETVSYGDDGRQASRTVDVYNEAGRLAEKETYDADDALVLRQVNSFDEGGRLTSETLSAGDGTLKQKRFLIYSAAKDRLLEIVTYDARGVLTRREVNSDDPQNQTSVWHIEEADGRRSEQTFDLGQPEPRLAEAVAYGAGGSVETLHTSSDEEPVRRLDDTSYNADGSVMEKTSQQVEYDSYKNVKRVNQVRWNKKSGALEPFAVLYNVITYD
jgi:hypothetical protein